MPHGNSTKIHPSGQLRLPIEYAPDPVRARIREAHSYPLVASAKGHSFRVPASTAWGYPFIELRSATAYTALIVDLDGRDASLAYQEHWRDIPEPGWHVLNLESGNSHLVWGFERPVLRGDGARAKPLNLCRRLNAYYTQLLKGDPGFVGVLSRNPTAGRFHVTTWSQEARPHSLRELSAAVPKGWRVPREYRDTGGVGRNCDVFRWAMQWSGKPCNWERSLELEACIAECERLNLEILPEQGRIPMGEGETHGIGRSVNRYAKKNRNTAQSYSLWQKHQGRKGGLASGKARREGSIEEAAPWVAEGVSRRTWYYRRKSLHSNP